MKQTVKGSTVCGKVQAPSSKSYAQRAIAAALLAKGKTTLENMELCSDTRAALMVSEALGAKYEQIDGSTYVITGNGHPHGSVIDIGESGLLTRLMLPFAAYLTSESGGKESVRITGHGSILGRNLKGAADPHL